MPPADERLIADTVAGLEVDARLVYEAELIGPVERLSNAAQELEAPRVRLIGVLVICRDDAPGIPGIVSGAEQSAQDVARLHAISMELVDPHHRIRRDRDP
jgi:hypothetical protein